MNILALDTSTDYCSVALWQDGSLDARDAAAGQSHSQLLLPMVDELLRRHGLAPRDLDGIAFGRGPGSFTGLRIGVTTAKTLAYATDAQIIAVNALEVIAAQAPRSPLPLEVVLDAQRQQLLTARFCWDDSAGWRAE